MCTKQHWIGQETESEEKKFSFFRLVKQEKVQGGGRNRKCHETALLKNKLVLF